MFRDCVTEHVEESLLGANCVGDGENGTAGEGNCRAVELFGVEQAAWDVRLIPDSAWLLLSSTVGSLLSPVQADGECLVVEHSFGSGLGRHVEELLTGVERSAIALQALGICEGVRLGANLT